MSELVELYVNKSGDTVLEIKRSTYGTYSFMGKGSLGAGGGMKSLEQVKKHIFGNLSKRKLNNIIKASI